MRQTATTQKNTLRSMKWILCFLVFICSNVFSQERTVTGTVKTGEGQPIPRATVSVKGTAIQTASDDKGNFTIRANTNATLVISAVGFASLETNIGSLAEINIVLSATDSEMENVVVTALGIRRDEKALGYSVSKVKGEELTNAMANNWTNALSGKVAGLNILKSGGGPAGSNKIVLRGENSLDGNSQALIVVD